MPFVDDSKLAFSFKKLLGKAQTDNDKAPFNEALSSNVSVSAGTVFGEELNSAPSNTSLYDTTDGNVEFVRLELVPDASSNGHAFIAQLPSDYEANTSNPKAGTGPFVNGQQVSLTNGKLQLVPPLYGTPYEGKPYRSGSGTQGSGDLVPPGDAVDFVIDYFSGVIFQENDPDTSPADMTHLEAFIYIGDMVTDSISGGIGDLPIGQGGNADVDTGATEVLDQVVEADVRAVKWFVSASKGTKMHSSEVFAASDGAGAVNHQRSHMVKMGGASNAFCQVGVDVSGGNLRLLADTDDTNVDVEVTRVITKR